VFTDNNATAFKLEQERIKQNRLTKMAQVFTRADSTLALRPINVHIVNQEGGAPAWSSANDVYFNASHINAEFDVQQLLAINGLNFHELAHVRYTPRNGSEICQWVIDNNYWSAFNALEDQRIETLMTARFPSTVNWFVATVAQYLLNTPEAFATSYALLRGRRYLPVDIRRMSREAFKAQEHVPAIIEIVDSYRTLLYPRDTERAKELIERFNDILKSLPRIDDQNGDNPNDDSEQTSRKKLHDPNGHDDRPFNGHESSDSRPAPKEEQQQDAERSKSIDKEDDVTSSESDSSPADSDDDSDSDDNTPHDSDSDSDDDSDSSEEGCPTPSDSDSDKEGDSEGKKLPSERGDFDDDVTVDDSEIDESLFDDDYNADNKSRHAGSAYGKDNNSKEVTDALEEIIESVTETLMKDLDRLSSQITDKPLMGTVNVGSIDKANFSEARANAELVLIQQQFAKELLRIKANYDPAWEYETRRGRLNMRRYLQGASLNKVFDKWSEGKDDVTAIEAVILLDRSQSMQGNNAKEAYKSMWAIKRSLDKAGANTTVITFDSYTRILYSAEDKADAGVIRDAGASGGTNPTNAILTAQNIFANTDKPIRLLFMITDGAWDSDKAEESVRKMREAGVITCNAIIEQYARSAESLERHRHQFELLHQIISAKDILLLGRQLVRLAIARNLVSR
jgi:uncharacterized protein YegL